MARRLTPERFIYDLPSASDPAVAPDGSRVLYTVGQANRAEDRNESQIWCSAIDGTNARRVTWTGVRNRGARWSPDGASFAFVSDRAPRSGIFLAVTGDIAEPRELIRHDHEISDLAWSADGKRIAYTVSVDPNANTNADSRVPRPRITGRIDYKRDTRGYLGDVRRQIFVLDVATGERRRLSVGAIDRSRPTWSPDGRWIAALISTAGVITSQLELSAIEGDERRIVGDPYGTVGTWAWSLDGTSILFTADPDRSGQPEHYVYSLADGSTRQITRDSMIVPNSGFPEMIPAAQPIWLDTGTVLFSGSRAGASGIYRLDIATGATMEESRDLSMRNGFSTDTALRYIAQSFAGPTETGEIVVTDRVARTDRVITSLSADVLAVHSLPTWERFEITRAGFTIDSWLLKPPGFDPARRYPAVIDIHGGPQAFYGYGFTPMQMSLAAAGFLVLVSNPRGSSSYGRAFVNAVRRDWGGEDYADLMAVVDAVAARPYCDEKRFGVFGYSYGGYMTSWIIGHTDRFAAAVCGAPCFNLVSMYGSSDIGHSFGAHHWGGAPHENWDWYVEHSPSTYAHHARTPTLLAHGEADDRCPIGQSEEMYTALKVAGCPVEYARYPGGSHLFQRLGPPSHRFDYLERVVNWFRRYLQSDATA
ncbi:MAG: S9 family peptidase [Chloroflexota bacterium]|nr:MAG: S9 family peptidase [Chloroflexota bacterium]